MSNIHYFSSNNNIPYYIINDDALMCSWPKWTKVTILFTVG